MKPEFFCNFGIFIEKNVEKLGLCLSGLHGIRLNLRRLVVFLNIHFMILVRFMLDCTMLLFGVTYVILLPIKLVHVLIMHAILSLTRLYL